MRKRPSPADRTVSIDGYDVYEQIGSGGFSIVYRARQQSMGRQVAVKVLNKGFASDEEQQRFERECHALGRLSHHPNIVTVFNEATTTDGRPCLVMELYSQTYRERIGEMAQLPLAEVLSVGIRMCGALQAAHDAGVMHRDLKPHNIFLSAYGEPALGDFGISTLDDERTHTGEGSFSIAYAAPEILEDGRPTVVADVYSLAATLFQLAEGSSPFASSDMKSAVRRILTEAPPALRNAEAPPGLQRVLHRALSKEPSGRHQSAIELAEALREVEARAGLGPTPIPRTTHTEPPLTADPTGISTRTSAGAPANDSAKTSAEASAPSSEPFRRDPEPADHLSSTPSSPSASAPSAPVPSAPLRAAEISARRHGVVDDDIGSLTIARDQPGSSKRRDRPVPTDETPRLPTWRRWVGPAAVTGVLLIGTVTFVTVRGGDGGDVTKDPIVPTTLPVDPIFEDVQPPGDVVLTAVDGGFEVSFVAAPTATSTEIELRNGADIGRIVLAESSPTLISTDAGTLCVQLRSSGEKGRLSQSVGPICSGG